MRVAGIDPGTKSFDLCGLSNCEVILDASIPSQRIAEDPRLIVEALMAVGHLELVVAPSGYGLPLTHISRVRRRELALISLIPPSEGSGRVHIGLRNVLRQLKRAQLNAYIIPGVKHLPTIPLHRKINKIDMGTSDKVCSAALGIYDQAKRFGIRFREASFILAELGFGYNAFLAVEKGAIVDGIGGTTGWAGMLSPGSMDSELVCLLPRISKEALTRGGLAYAAGADRHEAVERFIKHSRRSRRQHAAWEAFIEGIVKGVLALKASAKRPREILIAGRLAQNECIYREAAFRLRSEGEVRRLVGFTEKAKQAAQGAALLADGLAGGRCRELVSCLRLREAKGNVLDYIYLEGVEELRRVFRT